MSHSIYAMPLSHSVASIGFGTINGWTHAIYKVLDAEKHDYGISGSGEYRYFVREDFFNALFKLNKMKMPKDEKKEVRKFLKDILGTKHEAFIVRFA